MKNKPPQPVHVAGTKRGEEAALNKKEPGRGVGKHYRTARDSTGINAAAREPIIPVMANIPPA
jgi:hypothetical protein